MGISVSYEQICAAAAQQLCTEAVAEAQRRQLAVGVCVLDREGMLKAFVRMDNAPAVAFEATRAKANAALMGLGSQQLGEVMADNLPNLLSVATLDNTTLLGGGLPIVHNGQLIGAIGVGGATTEDDIAIAEYALNTLTD